MKPLLLLIVANVVLLAGCTGDDGATSTESTPASLTVPARVYFVRDGKVWPTAREVEGPGMPIVTAALDELLAGPTEHEETDLGFATAIPDGTEIDNLVVTDGVAQLTLSAALSDESLAQVVYTLTQFPTVRSVKTQERTLTRSDFEDQTPSVLVESPLPFEEVTSPLRATGTANTFEATFNYELTDTDGKIVDENFVNATSGTGTRGTFDFTTKPFTVPFDGIGSLIVFELSAKDGSRINIVEIPLRMKR